MTNNTITNIAEATNTNNAPKCVVSIFRDCGTAADLFGEWYVEGNYDDVIGTLREALDKVDRRAKISTCLHTNNGFDFFNSIAVNTKYFIRAFKCSDETIIESKANVLDFDAAIQYLTLFIKYTTYLEYCEYINNKSVRG